MNITEEIYDDYYYYQEEFPGLSDVDIQFWNKVDDFIAPLSFYLDYVNFITSIIGVIANIFHLIVLTRKSMISSSINIFMIGIAICDLGRMISIIIILIPKYYHVYQESQMPAYCIPPNSLFCMVMIDLFSPTFKVSQEISVWLGVTMATVRALVIRYPLQPRINCLVDSKYGVRLLLLVSIFICPLWFLHYFQIIFRQHETWSPSEDCPNFSENVTKPVYVFESTDFLGPSGTSTYEIILIVEGVLFKLIPSALLPIATFLLIYQLGKAKRVKSSRNTDCSHRSTKLVTFVTISFFISTAPLGILYLIEFHVFHSNGLVHIIENLTSIFIVLSVINGTVHFLICFFMSSQYRNTVKEMLGIRGKLATPVIVAQSKNIPPDLYSTMMMTISCHITLKDSQEISIWLGVTMAIVRALVTRYPLEPRINCLLQAKYGFRLLVSVVSGSTWYYWCGRVSRLQIFEVIIDRHSFYANNSTMNAEFVKMEIEVEDGIVASPELQMELLQDEVEYLEMQLFDAKEEVGKVEREKDEIIAQLQEKLRNQQIQIDMYEENFDLKKININKKRLIDIEIKNKQIQKKKEFEIQELEKANEKMRKEIMTLRFGDLVYIEKQKLDEKYFDLKNAFDLFFIKASETKEQLEDENEKLVNKVKEAQKDLIEANSASLQFMFQLGDTQKQLASTAYENEHLMKCIENFEKNKCSATINGSEASSDSKDLQNEEKDTFVLV